MKKLVFSNDPVTATSSFHKIADSPPRSESISARIDKWFIAPLRRMDGDEGFLVLLVLFPLYEKHLRVACGFDGNFSEGNKIFSKIGKHLKIPATDAYIFWTHVRNGLLHQAQPKTSAKFDYGLRSDGLPIERIHDRFWINPFALRDVLIPVIEDGIPFWRNDNVPVAFTFEPNETT